MKDFEKRQNMLKTRFTILNIQNDIISEFMWFESRNKMTFGKTKIFLLVGRFDHVNPANIKVSVDGYIY